MSGNRLGGRQGTAYTGTNATQPPNWNFNDRDPNQYDTQNVALGDLWMNTATREVWVLVSLQGDVNSRGPLADWIMFSGGSGTVVSLTGNTGGVVDPDINGNINVVGDGTTITITGNPGTNTLTASLVGGTVAADSFPTGVGASTTSGGTALPTALGVVNVLGSHNVLTGAAVANTITVFGTNAITLGDLAVIPPGSYAITCTTGDITLAASTATAATNPKIVFGISDDHISFLFGNVFIGRTAGNNTMTISQAIFNIGIGQNSLNGLTTGGANVCVGNGTGQVISTGSNNNYYGYVSGSLTTTGNNNCGYGTSSLMNLLTGSNNIAIGFGAGSSLTAAESTNTLIGYSGIAGTSNLFAAAIGSGGPVFIHNYGSGNSFVGPAGNFTLTTGSAVNNTGQGNTSLQSLTTGSNNSAMGNATLQGCTTGINNTSVGAASLQNLTTSQQNTGVGAGTLTALTTGSGQNIGIGFQSLTNLGTGTLNVCVGQSAGSNYTTTESNNIIIGNISGVVGESSKTKIAGIRGATTTNNDAIAVLIDSVGQLGTVSSSIRFKENIADMADFSSPLMSLRPVVFNYKERPTNKKEYGLIAEEVVELFPDLVVYNQDGEVETIKYHVLSAILLNELQKLSQRVTELEKRLS